jgi:hypothetical protein
VVIKEKGRLQTSGKDGMRKRKGQASGRDRMRKRKKRRRGHGFCGQGTGSSGSD